MTFTLYQASAPAFLHGMAAVEAWLDKALAEGGDEAALMEARLAPDMKPFPARSSWRRHRQGRDRAADRDRGARHAGHRDQLRRAEGALPAHGGLHRGRRPRGVRGGGDREVELRFPNGRGYRWSGRDYLTGFALPNFYFHLTTTYALLRAGGVALGKPDFLRHLGPPNLG
jgi:hypothetical protein